MKRTLDAAREHQWKPPLPNFVAGPGLPRPVGINFYTGDWHYSAYLVCEYPVSENHYDQSNEPAWFKAALLQIRATGRKRFPPFKWVAVVIGNDAEKSFWQSFKVGAIFRMDEVFDLSTDLSQLVAQAKMDRQPFMYDPKQPTPGEQQRWLIVERHAAANPPAPGSN